MQKQIRLKDLADLASKAKPNSKYCREPVLEMEYEQDKYSAYQNSLYKMALAGLKYYSESELQKMSLKKKEAIQRTHYRVQKTLNLLKQEVTNKICNDIFSRYFPKSELSITMQKKFNFTSPNYWNTLSFKALRIEKDQIIQRLIKKGLLPRNFHELKHPPKPHSNGRTVSSERRSLTLTKS
jgi:predicted transcriptional regulator